MKKLFLLILSFVYCSASCQDIVGTWSGRLQIGDQKLRIVFNISARDGVYAATLDSPDQGAKGIAASSIEYNSQQLAIGLDKLMARYVGRLSNDTLIDGTFTQSGYQMALRLTRGSITLVRPQEPTPPYPYRSEDVVFDSRQNGVKLAGTLTLPNGGGAFAGVVLVSGSGPQDRNEQIANHKPFLVIADYLTSRGIAVLRYDDRGTNSSTGDFASSTTADFTLDALGAFDYLHSHKQINGCQIGIVGHSEGGIIAFMVAATERKKVAFVVSMAGAAIRGDSILIAQNRTLLLDTKIDTAVVDSYVDALKTIFKIQQTHSAEFIASNVYQLTKEIFTERHNNLPQGLRTNAIAVLTKSNKWMDYFKNNDPAPYIALSRCPILALNGDKDLQVDADHNLSIIKANARRSLKTIKYEGLNHLFQSCTTGSPTQYGQIEQTISPLVLEDICRWITDLTK